MEYEPLKKKIRLLNSSNCRIFVHEYFKDLINEIDMEAESLLMNLNDELFIKNINDQRASMIIEIKAISDLNLNGAEKLQSTISDGDVIAVEDLFKQYCFYLNMKVLTDFTIEKERLGLLVISDFYVSKDNIDQLK